MLPLRIERRDVCIKLFLLGNEAKIRFSAKVKYPINRKRRLIISKFRKPCCREKGGLGEKAISFQFSLIHLAAFLPAMRPNVNASVRPFPPSLFSP